MTNRKSKIRVSVLLCAYNAEAVIRTAIESVLAQTFRDFEFIIIDDGSTDNTRLIVQGYQDSRIKLVACKHNYIHSLNVGLRKCHGTYIARLDADDMMMPERLATQLEVMDADAQIAVCCSWGVTFGDVEKMIGHHVREYVDNAYFWLLTGNYLMHPSAMLRREFLKANRIYYKDYPYAEDYKLWTDITMKGGKIYVIPKELLKYRVSSSQVSFRHHEQQVATRLRIQQEVLEHLLSELKHPQQRELRHVYRTMMKLNDAELLQGDEIIYIMYKLLRRTKAFVK